MLLARDRQIARVDPLVPAGALHLLAGVAKQGGHHAGHLHVAHVARVHGLELAGARRGMMADVGDGLGLDGRADDEVDHVARPLA